MKKRLRNKSKKQCRHKHKKRCLCTKRHRKMSGGNVHSASFQPFQQSPGQYYYDVNNHNNDPNDPSVVMSTRNAPNMMGGKSRRRRGRKSRKMRGGNLILGNGSLNNSLTSFGNLDGAFIGKSIFSGQPILDGSVINQPAYLTYNSNSPPMV